MMLICSLVVFICGLFFKSKVFSQFIRWMSNKNYLEKAIQLVSINSFGKLMLHAEGVDFLRSLNAPVAIVTITGPVKTGKSFLMNQLISKQDAFEVGYNNTSITKGLWLWSKPVLAYNDEGKIVSVVLIDSEGFRTEQTNDRRILTLLLLFSSCIVYNSMGPINKRSLTDLQELLQVVRIFPVQQNVAFSDFHWIVRDYNSNLVNQFGIEIIPKQYMENCLLQINEKQLLLTIQTLKTYFPTRTCHCLLQPNDGQDEQHPKFMQHVIQLRKIFNGIRSFDLDGHSLAIILESYVEVLNNEGSLQKVYEEGQDCRMRLNCLQKLNEELKSLQQKQSLNEVEDIDEKMYDIRTNLKEHYKQRMCSYRQIKMLDQEINEILQDFREMIELRPGVNSYKEMGRSKSIIRMPVAKQEKMARVSLNMQQVDQLVSSNEVRASVSFNRINTSKNLQSKLQDYEAKVYRYELQASCTKKQMQCLKEQYDNSKRALEEKYDEMQTMIVGFKTKQKIFQSRICELEEQLIQMQKEKMLAQSEIQKIRMLTSEKIQNLQGQLADIIAVTTKQREERQILYKNKFNEYLNEIDELKHSHEEEIIQLKSIYTSSHQKSSDSNAVKATENFYENMREQMEIIEKLKEDNDKIKYSKLQLEDSLKTLRSRLQNREEYFKDNLEQQVKRSREAEKHLESVCETKLTSKEKIIEELQARIVELTRCKQQKESHDDRLIRAKNNQVVELRVQISKRVAALQNLNMQREDAKKQIEQIEQKLSKCELQIKKYSEKTQLLEKDVYNLREENDGLKSINQKNKYSFEMTIVQNQSIISEIQAQLQGERTQRQFLVKQHESQLGQIQDMFETDKLRLQQRIDQLNETIEGYRRMQMQFEDLQHESTETEFELREALDDRDKELERIRVQQTNVRKQLEQLKTHNSESIESMAALKQEMQIGYDETVNEMKREKEEEQKKYDTILHTLGCKQKQLYVMSENSQKDRRVWSYKEEEYKTTINELIKANKEREELTQKESQRLKGELSKTKRQNIELQNKIALLTQKIIFIEQSIAAKTEGRRTEQTKIVQKTNKMEERYLESIRTKDGQIESMRKLIAICMKEKQIAIQNISQLQQKFKADQRRCETHLNLFQRKLEEVKQQNRQLKQTLQQYRQDYQQLKQLKESTEHNYNRDSQLWHGKLSICEQKILALKSAK